MARGDILLVSEGRDIAARIIVFVTRNPVHHAAIDRGDGTAVSAETTGVCIKPISDFARVQAVTIGTPEQREQAAWFAEGLVKQPYNKAAFILAGLSSLGLVPRFLEQALADLVDGHGYICSSLVDTVFLAAGVDILPGPSAFTWPGELVQLTGPAAVNVATA